ncbi:MAG: VOC family protein [Fulvivirga sp.]
MMKNLNPYLTFNGNCEEAFNFYRSVFGGDFTYIGRFSEMPSEYKVSDKDKNLVMHVTLPLGEHGILMGSDTSTAFGPPVVEGNNFSISIEADSKDEADKLYSRLAEGGKETMPMTDTFWGSYFGMLTDQFGIQWMVSAAEK